MKNTTEDEVFKTFKKNHRTDIKRQINKLNKIGALSLRMLSSNDSKTTHMRLFFKMYEKRWTSIGHLNPMEKNRKKLFFENIFNNVDKSNLHFSGLFLDEKPLSYHIGFTYNKWFYYYKPTFDFSFRNYSPGKIHIWYLIKDSINSDLDRFDFGIGYENYKRDWANEANETTSYIISKNKNFKYKWNIKWKEFLKLKLGFLYRKFKYKINYH